MSREIRTNRLHGAGWLTRLLYLIQVLLMLMLCVVALWLIYSFPVWNRNESIFPLSIDAVVQGGAEVLPQLVSDEAIRRVSVEQVSADLRVVLGNPWKQWLYTLVVSQYVVLSLALTILLRRIVQSIAAGQAFSRRNAVRLRWIGLIMLAGAIVVPGIFGLMTRMILSDISIGGGTLAVDWVEPFTRGDFITGWVLLILSEVFRQGAAMEEEQSLTV